MIGDRKRARIDRDCDLIRFKLKGQYLQLQNYLNKKLFDIYCLAYCKDILVYLSLKINPFVLWDFNLEI